MSFRCTRCGACCRLVGAVPELVHLDRGDGACKHLVGTEGEAHTCAIYEDRPRACRVDEQVPAAMTLDEWHRRNERACERVHLLVYGGP